MKPSILDTLSVRSPNTYTGILANLTKDEIFLI